MASVPIRRLVASTVLLAVTSCRPAGSVVSVTIVGGDRHMLTDTSVTLDVDVRTNGAVEARVDWASDSEEVATITADGTLSAHAAGVARVTATSAMDRSQSHSIAVRVAAPGTLRFTRQFGTAQREQLYGLAADPAGDVYAVGYTYGSLEGPNAGFSDAFVRSYDANGDLRWSRQFGTIGDEAGVSIASDVSGNLYVGGYTSGSLDGTSAGGIDALLRSYDSAGNLRWARQFGSPSFETVEAIAADGSGAVYLAGYTQGALESPNAGAYDVFVRSYDVEGEVRWTRQFGTSSSDVAKGVATDGAGNVYVVGHTFGALYGASSGSSDAFVRSYDRSGNVRWTRQFGTDQRDNALAVATDLEGSVYIVGWTDGALDGSNTGLSDAWLRSYDSAGTVRWTSQFGTASDDSLRGVEADPEGFVYVFGQTSGALDAGNAGSSDVFLRMYGPDGELLWGHQFGTANADYAEDLALGAEGAIFVGGVTDGAMEGVNAGVLDAYVVTYGR